MPEIIQGDCLSVMAGMDAASVDCELEIRGMGFNNTGYPGAFTPTVQNIIRTVIGPPGQQKVLNLFSGVSTIGDERVDLERPEATLRENVREFIARDERRWDFVLLDPPYEIKRKSKLAAYGSVSSVAADVPLRRELAAYLVKHACNVLWLDACAPLPSGFDRRRLWLLLPGGYHMVRILSWLIRKPGLFATRGGEEK